MRSRSTIWGWICVGAGVAVLVVMAILWGVGVWGPGERGDRSCDRDGWGRGTCERQQRDRDDRGPGMWVPGSGSVEDTLTADMDSHFIVQMIPHHEDAVAMAQLALTKADHPELRELAQTIIAVQTREIDQMRGWYQAWYGEEVPEAAATPMGGGMMGEGMMGGGMMGEGMMMGEMDLEALETSAEFDKAFIEQMIPHHQMGVMMARMIAGITDRPELESLGRAIITGQTNEIEQMNDWYEAWYQ